MRLQQISDDERHSDAGEALTDLGLEPLVLKLRPRLALERACR